MDILNPDLDKVKQLALKLKEMAERGTEHERVVAEKKLTSLLKKYNLTLKDINENKTKIRFFTFANDDERMVVAHVIWSVVPNIDIKRKANQKKAYCEINAEQYIEVKEKLKFYISHFKSEKYNFTIAYILKNNLQVKGSDKSDDSNNPNSDLDLKSVSNLIGGINEGKYESKKKKRQVL